MLRKLQAPGAVTKAAGWAIVAGALVLLMQHTNDPPLTPPLPTGDSDTDRRLAAVFAALREFARVNVPGAPPADPAVYWAWAADKQLSATELKTLDWCGGFYLWALKVGGVAPITCFWRFDGTGIASAHLKLTTDPKSADLAYFTHNQHHALIEVVDGDVVHLINGNGGGQGITRSTVTRSQVAAFYSVQPLLDAEPSVA